MDEQNQQASGTEQPEGGAAENTGATSAQGDGDSGTGAGDAAESGDVEGDLPPACDCVALPVTHRHLPSGPVAID